METLFNTTEEKMKKTLKNLSSEFASVRAGRANASILDKIVVDYYGAPTPINQLAAVSVSEARILTITPWDSSTLSLIEKAIQASDVGINPQNDGKIIRLIFPQLTEDRRKEIVKSIKKTSEDAKIAVRAIRRDSIEKLKKMQKSAEITEDDLKIGEDKIQKITDVYIKNVDDKLVDKEKEIMEI